MSNPRAPVAKDLVIPDLSSAQLIQPSLPCTSNGYYKISKPNIQKLKLDNSDICPYDNLLHKGGPSVNQEYFTKIEEVQLCLDKVREMVRPGCPPHMLNVALTSMSMLVTTLSKMSSKPYPPSSL
ncbi:PREDICTED: pyrophosphate--fructose 6-phosphate 1-phosphotransferase subunit alpha-like isoform X1 [Nicotiana attenuata]|uniref:pyrophosphate--fructose 6-phosphate 1-phosphotransferase subunit alpha-like isoform X1 n=1 Tax=Nicotiana attenuata TaxID=49451 RepID=UPI000905938D|nr:PREDICTED: pyrophosphate--fructose 6-phosphate 1-phosphotransferase subunit alpha-like isoform X1 [Nicotiana attenuata]